ncbi:coiled-coil domain-containing protein 169 [Stigmatopora argus]
MNKDERKHETVRLRIELGQEREIRDLLERSVRDLRCTVGELQDRLRGVDEEDNEWKTRYQTQGELNVQLRRQLALVHERLDQLRGKPADPLASIRSYDDLSPGSLRRRLKVLSDNKCQLESQLADCQVHVEEGAKAFHKTNDERRAYLSEMAKLSSTVEAPRRHYSVQPRGATESKARARAPRRESETETDGKKGKGRAADLAAQLKKCRLGSSLKHRVKQ